MNKRMKSNFCIISLLTLINILKTFLFFFIFPAHPENGMPLFEMRGDNSLVMSIELNSVLYQGVLYPRGVPGHPLIGIPVPRSSASPK